MPRICALIDHSGDHSCDFCPFPSEHQVSMELYEDGSLLAIGFFHAGGCINYISNPNQAILEQLKSLPTVYGGLPETLKALGVEAKEFFISLGCLFSVMYTLNIHDPIDHLVESEIHRIADIVLNPENELFLYAPIVEHVKKFRDEYAKLFTQKKFNLYKMSDLEEQTEMALEEIDRKLSSCLEDIEDASERLERTCATLATKVADTINEQCESFGTQLETLVASKVTNEVTNQTKAQVDDLKLQMDLVNSRLDKILNLLNLLK